MKYILEYNRYDQFDIDCDSIESQFIMRVVDEYPIHDIRYKFVRHRSIKDAFRWKDRKNQLVIFFYINLEKIMDEIPIDPNRYTSEQTPDIYTQVYSSIDRIDLTDKFKNAFNSFIKRVVEHFRKQTDNEDEKLSQVFKSMSDRKDNNITDDDINKFLSLKLNHLKKWIADTQSMLNSTTLLNLLLPFYGTKKFLKNEVYIGI